MKFDFPRAWLCKEWIGERQKIKIKIKGNVKKKWEKEKVDANGFLNYVILS